MAIRFEPVMNQRRCVENVVVDSGTDAMCSYAAACGALTSFLAKRQAGVRASLRRVHTSRNPNTLKEKGKAVNMDIQGETSISRIS
jgi:hypothetical protein